MFLATSSDENEVLNLLIFTHLTTHFIYLFWSTHPPAVLQRIGCRAVFQKLAADFMYTLEEEERDQQWAFYFQGTFEVIYYAQ